MARPRRKFRPLSFESLEDRQMLAGNVTANIVSGDLVVNGDNLDNGITIAAGTTAGSVVVTGVNAGGSATNVNGTANGAVPLSGFTGRLKITMNGGNDSVSITGLTVPRKSEIDGGEGNDSIAISGTTFNRLLEIGLEGGDDTLSLANVNALRKAEIEGKSGVDQVTITNSNFRELQTALGGDNDSLNISGTTVHKKTELAGGRGTNTFTNGTGNSLADMRVRRLNNGNTNSTPPTLSISGPASVNEGAVYTLGLSASGTGASTISRWTINWGDGTAPDPVTGNPSSVQHTFADGLATRTISATATNPNGTFNAASTVPVTVNNVPRSPTISGAPSVFAGATYTLNLSSTDPGADTVIRWTIDWGDGTAPDPVTGNPSSAVHTFTNGAGTRTISATATDEDGTFNATNNVVVTVNVPPTLSISGAASVNEGSAYTLTLSASGTGASTISQWTINWGDGTAPDPVTGNPPIATHTFADGLATHTISATATNPNGTFNAPSTVAVTVNNVPRSPRISGAPSVDEGAVYSLSLSSMDPGTDIVSQWTINWGDGSQIQTVIGDPSSAVHTFTNGAVTRTISATATDEDGTVSASGMVTVTVNDVG